MESKTHIVGKCVIYKEERDVLEKDMRGVDDCDVEEFDTLDSSERTIAILGDRWPKRKGIVSAKSFYVIYGNDVMSAQLLEVSPFGVGTVLRLTSDAWSMAK